MRALVSFIPAALLLAACGQSATPAAAPSSAVASSAAKPPASAAASGSANTATSQKLAMKSAYTTTAATMTPQWVTKDAGYFDQQGLDVTLARIEAGAPILAAVQGGDVPLAFAGSQQIVEADLKGAQFVVLAGFVDVLGQQVYTIPSITKPEQLKGQALGVTNFGAVTHVAGRIAAKQLGIDGQVSFIATGGPPETLAAVKTGKVVGGVFAPPQNLQAEKEGLHLLYDVSTSGVKSQTAAVITLRQYAKDHPELAERYLKAALQGVHRAMTDRQQSVASIRKYGGVDDDDIAGKTYDYYKDEWVKDGAPSIQGIQQNLDLAAETIPEAKGAKPQDFVDTTILDKIKASGFIDQLWKS